MKTTKIVFLFALLGLSLALSVRKPKPLPQTCKTTGCSGEVCSDQDVNTMCMWREEFACYKSATCERQKDGQCGWTQTAELQQCIEDASAPVVFEPVVEECRATGCSGEVCSDQDIASICIWKEEFACYSSATCERQKDGKCGWTQTAELEQCLESSSTPVVLEPVVEECRPTGCSGEVCSDQDMPTMSICLWREEFACYRSATCERQKDGKCGWTQTAELEKCLESSSAPVVFEPVIEECRPTGCSGEVCSDQDVNTMCMWSEEFICYRSATCERQKDGQCGWTQTAELQQCIEDASAPVVIEPTVGECRPTGCSGEVCSDQDISSICIWRPEFECYKSATCERQKDGQCGWTQSKKLDKCVKAANKPAPCKPTGCSGEICSDQDGLSSICLWKPEFDCYKSAVCKRQKDGQCGWTSTKKLDKCLKASAANSKA